MTTYVLTSGKVVTCENFSAVVTAVNKRASTVTADTQVLVHLVHDKARKDGDFNMLALLLDQMRKAERYMAVKQIIRYVSDFGPYSISFNKKKDKHNVRKDGSDNARKWCPLPDENYNEYKIEALEKLFDLVAATQSIEGIIKKIEETEDMSGAEKNVIYLRVKTLAEDHIKTNLPDVKDEVLGDASAAA